MQAVKWASIVTKKIPVESLVMLSYVLMSLVILTSLSLLTTCLTNFRILDALKIRLNRAILTNLINTLDLELSESIIA